MKRGMPSGGHRSPTAFIFLVNSPLKKFLFPLTMGLAGRIPESLNRHPNTPTAVPASGHDHAFLVPFAPPGFEFRRQGNLTLGGFLDGAHWACTFARPLDFACRLSPSFHAFAEACATETLGIHGQRLGISA